jgi:hypothetical protein
MKNFEKNRKSDFERQMEGNFESKDFEAQIAILEETIELDVEMINTMIEEIENMVEEKDKEDTRELLNLYFNDLKEQIRKASNLLKEFKKLTTWYDKLKTIYVEKEENARKKESKEKYKEKTAEIEKKEDKVLEMIKETEELRKEASTAYLKKNNQKEQSA